MVLREQIAAIFNDALDATDGDEFEYADRLLAIPEIRDALAISDAFPENDFRDYLLKRGRWEGVSAGAGYV